MFFKVTETCTVDTSGVYTRGESEVNIFEAPSLESIDGYFKDLSDYSNAHGLTTLVEILDANEVDSEMKANDCWSIINVNNVPN